MTDGNGIKVAVAVIISGAEGVVGKAGGKIPVPVGEGETDPVGVYVGELTEVGVNDVVSEGVMEPVGEAVGVGVSLNEDVMLPVGVQLAVGVIVSVAVPVISCCSTPPSAPEGARSGPEIAWTMTTWMVKSENITPQIAGTGLNRGFMGLRNGRFIAQLYQDGRRDIIFSICDKWAKSHCEWHVESVKGTDKMDLPTIPIASKKILIVDNDNEVRGAIAKVLEIEGYTVYQSQDGTIALKYIEQITPDLIISDINLQNPNGTEFYKIVRQNPNWTAIPFIFLTSDPSPEAIQRGKELGVEDFLIKPIEPNSLARIVSARLLRAAELQIALIDTAYLETITVLANTVEGRDPYTHGHIDRVTMYTQWLAEDLEWPNENMRILAFGARLHDIGKIVVPDQILTKPGNLNEEEWELMKRHPVEGSKILNNIHHLKPAVNYVLYHHERWDGSGYPQGLAGRDIPIEGRILAISDVYDALSTTRPYHPALPQYKVMEYLNTHAGVQFDPDLVPIFIEAIDKRTRKLN